MARRIGLWMLLPALAALAGCAVPQPQNTPVPHRRQVSPVTGRAYWIYVPSTYRHDRPAPLVVTCHGTPPYDVASMHIRELKMLGEKSGCIVVAPELIATDGIFGDGPLVGMQADENYILMLISLLGYQYNIDLANIMITGFSGGGFPAYWVGLRHPDIFRCVVARSCNFSQGNLDGWYPPEARKMDVKVYYCERDPAAIIAQSQHAIRYLRSQGFQVATEMIPGRGHERVPEVAMKFFLDTRRTPQPSLPTVATTPPRTELDTLR